MTARREPVILLTGVNGQVGFELARDLQGLGRIVAPERGELNLAEFDQIRRVVREVRPTLIVNPAAYTAVDQAESDVANAMRVNGEAPGILAEEAQRLGVPLLHFSTDYVFDGSKPEPYVESDEPAPCNVYGASKLAGERAIAQTGCAHLVFRTSWVYGRRGKNFLLTMLRLANERSELKIVADQVGAPTWSRTIATLVAHIAAQGLAAQADEWDWWSRRSGVYHLSASGSTSWAGFAQAIFELAALPKVPAIVPISAEEYPVPAKRPANSQLSSEKLVNAFGLRAPAWRDALSLCLVQSSLGELPRLAG